MVQPSNEVEVSQPSDKKRRRRAEEPAQRKKLKATAESSDQTTGALAVHQATSTPGQSRLMYRQERRRVNGKDRILMVFRNVRE